MAVNGIVSHSLPEMPQIGEVPSVVRTIGKLLPSSWTEGITFFTACVATIQIAITFFTGGLVLCLVNTVVGLGCWLGYMYVCDEAQIENLRSLAEIFQTHAQKQEQISQQRAEQLALQQTNQTQLAAKVEELSQLLARQEDQLADYKHQLDTASSHLDMRQDQINEKAAQIEAQERQIADLRDLVPEERQADQVVIDIDPAPKEGLFETEHGRDLLAIMSQLRELDTQA